MIIKYFFWKNLKKSTIVKFQENFRENYKNWILVKRVEFKRAELFKNLKIIGKSKKIEKIKEIFFKKNYKNWSVVKSVEFQERIVQKLKIVGRLKKIEKNQLNFMKIPKNMKNPDNIIIKI